VLGLSVACSKANRLSFALGRRGFYEYLLLQLLASRRMLLPAGNMLLACPLGFFSYLVLVFGSPSPMPFDSLADWRRFFCLSAGPVQYASVTRPANNTARLLRSGPLHLDPDTDLDLEFALYRSSYRCSCHSKVSRSAAPDQVINRIKTKSSSKNV